MVRKVISNTHPPFTPKRPAYQPQLVHCQGHESQAPLGRPALQGPDCLGIMYYLAPRFPPG